MQPEEVLDQVVPAQTTPPAQEPAGLMRRKQLHALLVKEHFDVPEDFEVFNQKIDEKPERLQKLHETLVADKFDVPADYTTFSEKLGEGLKKKGQATPETTGSVSSTGLANGGTISPDPNPPKLNAPTTDGEPSTASISISNPDVAAVLDPVQVAEANQPKVYSPGYTGPVPVGTYMKPSDKGTEREGTQYSGGVTAAPAEAPDVADDGFWASFGKGFINNIDPKRWGGNLIDYFGDLAEMQARLGVVPQQFGAGIETRPGGVGSAEEIASPLSADKPTDKLAADLLARAQASDLPLSQAAQKSFLSDPSLASAGNLLGSGAASIVPVMATSMVAGPGAGAAVGAGMGISGTKETARAAGIDDKEAATMATVLAPIQGALEAMGVSDPGVAKLAVREALREALVATEGKLTAQALAAAAKKIVPELGRRALASGVREGGTELAQGEVEGAAQLAADALRDPAKPGYGVSAFDALVKNPAEQALAGAVLGGVMGAAHGPGKAGQQQPAAAPAGEVYPTEGPTYSAPAAEGQPAIEGARIVRHFLSPQGVETYRVVTPEGAAHEVPVGALQMDAEPTAAEAQTTPVDEPRAAEPAPDAAPDGTPTPFPTEKTAALERLERARTRLVEAQAAAKKKGGNIAYSTIVPLPTVDVDVVKAYLELGAAHIANGVVTLKGLVTKLREDDEAAPGLSTSEAEREQQLTTLARHALAAAGQQTDLPAYNPNRPAAHRAAGGFVRDGAVVERQGAVPAERLAAGKKTNVRFSGKDKASARYVVMEADDLQPSHRKGGENERHFLPEAQPKERGADVSKDSEASIRQIADAPDVSLLGQSDNAYFGAPVVNNRGEVVQGNGRSEGVLRHYEDAADGGAQFRADTQALAAEVGIPADELGKFQKPVVVRMLDVADNDAVRLGNYDVKDLESGGQQRVDPAATANRMDAGTKSRLSQILGDNSDNITTLTGLIKARGGQLVDLLSRKGLLSQTQRATILDANGNLNSDGIKAMRGVLRELVIGGNKRLSTFYSRLPAPVRGGIDRALLHIAAGEGAADFREDLRNVLGAMRERAAWMKKSGGTAKDWMSTPELFGDRQQTPNERLSPTEKALLGLLDRNSKGTGSAKVVYESLRNFAEATQGRPGDMFNAEVPGVAKEDALNYLARPKSERAKPGSKPDAVQARANLAEQTEKQRTTIRERVDALEDERQQTGAKPFTSLPAELVKHYADLGALLLREKAMSLKQFAARLRQEHEGLGLTTPLTEREIKRTYNQAVGQLERTLGGKVKFTRERLRAEMKDLKESLRNAAAAAHRGDLSIERNRGKAAVAAAQAQGRGDASIERARGEQNTREAVASERARAKGDAAIEAQRQREKSAAKDAQHRGDMLIEQQRAADEKAQLQARAKAYREAVKAQRKIVTDWLTANRSRFAGHVKGKEMASIMRRVNEATTNQALTKALDYAENVLAKKEYAAQLADAEKLRREVKKSSTTDQNNRQVTAADRALLADFAKLDPAAVDDLGAYTTLAKQLVQGTKNPTTKVDAATGVREKAPGRVVSQADARAYVDGELARMEAQKQQDLLDRFGHLKDAQGNPLLKSGTTAAEMSALVNEALQLSPDDLQQAKDAAEALAQEKRDVLEAAAHQMQTDAFLGNHLVGLPEDIHDALLYVNPSDLSDKVLARFIGVLDNIMTNGNIDGAGDVVAEAQAAQAAYELPREMLKAGVTPGDITAALRGDYASMGPVARKLIGASKAAKKLKGGIIQGVFSLDLLTELIGRTVEQTARIKRAIGIDGVSEGYARSNNMGGKLRDGYEKLIHGFGKVAAEKARLPINIIRRGVLAHVVQHQGGGPAELRKQFAAQKEAIEKTYTRLLESEHLESKEQGRLVKQAYDELLGSATTGDEAVAAMKALGQDGANNLKVVDYFQAAFAGRVDALDNHLRLYHNQGLARFENYTSTRALTLDKSGLARAAEEGQEALTGSPYQSQQVSTKQAGTTMERKGLGPGQVLDLDFDALQERRYFEANYDIESGAARRLFNSAAQRKELQAAFGGKKNTEVLYERVKGMVDAHRGIGAASNEAVKTSMQLFTLASREGARLALQGVFQLPKQYVSVMTNTLGMLGRNAPLFMKGFGLVHGSGTGFDDFVNERGYSISQRVETEAGLNRDVTHLGINRMDVLRQERSAGQRSGQRVLDGITAVRRAISKPLTFSDASVAKASWAGFYLESLASKGVDVSKVTAADLPTLGTKAQQDAAASYAEQNVSRAQNVNDKTKAGPLYQEKAGDSAAKILRTLGLPFSGFAVNQRARMMIDGARVFEGGVLNGAPGKGRAYQSLAATTAEAVVFNALKILVIRQVLAAGASGIMSWLDIPHDEKDEDSWGEKLKQVLGTALKELLAGGFGGVVEDAAGSGINALYAKTQDTPEGQYPKRLVSTMLSNPNQVDFSGLGGIAPLVQRLYMLQQAAPYLDGRAERNLSSRTKDTETVDIPKGEAQAMRLAFLINTLALIGPQDADMLRLTDKVQRQAQRNLDEANGTEKYTKRRSAGKGPVSTEAKAAAADNREVVRGQAEHNVEVAKQALRIANLPASEREAAQSAAEEALYALAGRENEKEGNRLRKALNHQLNAAIRFKKAPPYIIEMYGINTRHEQGLFLKAKLADKSPDEQRAIIEEVEQYDLLKNSVRKSAGLDE